MNINRLSNYQINVDGTTIFVTIFSLACTSIWIKFATINFGGYGDEPYYYLAAKTWSERGLFFEYIPNLYTTGNSYGEQLSKPPLNYLIPFLFYKIGNGNPKIYALFPPIFFLSTLLLIYFAVRKIYNKNVAVLTVVTTAGIPLLTHFTVITYMNIPSMFFYTLATFLLLIALKDDDKKMTVLSGIALGLSMLATQFTISLFMVSLFYIRKENWKKMVTILLISLAISSIWFVKNFIIYKNPLFPDLPLIGNFTKMNKSMWEIRTQVEGFVPITNLFNYEVQFGYFLVYLFLYLLGISYFITNKLENDNFPLVVIFFSFLPILFIGAKDIRYIIHFVPLLLLTFAVMFDELNTSKYKKYAFIFAVAALSITSIYLIYTEAERIYPLRETGKEKTYLWIAQNTEKNAVIYDLLSPLGLMLTGMYDRSSNRTFTFPHIYTEDDLWKFWERENAKDILDKHKIDYIVVWKYFFLVPKEQRKYFGWTHIPEEFLHWARSKEWIMQVHENELAIVFKVIR